MRRDDVQSFIVHRASRRQIAARRRARARGEVEREREIDASIRRSIASERADADGRDDDDDAVRDVADGSPRRRASGPGDARERAVGAEQEERHVCRSRADAVVLLRCRTGAVTRDRRHLPAAQSSQFDRSPWCRVCNALALLQCVASHPDTRGLFLAAHIPLFLYPFLNTVSKTRPFEYLRLTSLGVIGALVKMDDTEVINFLLSTEIIPLCLRTMELGSELSKTVATFIVQKILSDEVGLSYICATAERCYAVGTV